MKYQLAPVALVLAVLLSQFGIPSCGGSNAPCPGGLALCSGACIDTTGDPLNCGSCANTCPTGQVCQGSSCKAWSDCKNNPCPGLSYCNTATNTCLPGCITSGQCPTGEVCDVATHTCKGTNPNDGGSDGGQNDGTDGGGTDDVCNEVHFDSSSIPPNMLIVVDKSSSMSNSTDPNNPGTSKLADLKTAVADLLTKGDGKIRFGWMQFPSDRNCGAGTVTIDVGDSSVASIRTALAALTAGGCTPTGGSLNAADSYQGLHDTSRGNFVMLVTDGMPTCPNSGQCSETTANKQLALTAVQTLHSHGIDTFVIGLGTDTAANPTLLNDMANAGGRPRAGNPSYYQANSLADLEAVFTTIGGMVIGCNLALSAKPDYPAYLWVYFDGVEVPKDTNHVNGWDYDPVTNQINFYGSYCDQLRAGNVQKVDIKMGCRPPT